MKFMRFEHGGTAKFGILEGKDRVRVYKGDMFAGAFATTATHALDSIRWLMPCRPSKMVALWNNSRIQIEELKRDTPKEVLWFLKPPSCFSTHREPIIYPVGQTERVVLEGELGIVIGRKCKAVSAKQAQEHIFGYTVINDVTAQDVVKRDPTFVQYDRGKGFDSFGVFGPVIETEVDPLTLRRQSFINGNKVQDFPVSDYVFDPYAIVAAISRTVTLFPGDVIACGTSLNAAPIAPGDTVEIRIEGIGSLINPVAVDQVNHALRFQQREARVEAHERGEQHVLARV